MPARLFGTAEYCQRATYILKMNKNEMNQNSRCEEFTSAGCFHPEIFTDLRKFNLFREQTLKNLIIQSKKFTFSTSKKVCLHFVKCKPSNMLKRCIFCSVWSGSFKICSLVDFFLVILMPIDSAAPHFAFFVGKLSNFAVTNLEIPSLCDGVAM